MFWNTTKDVVLQVSNSNLKDLSVFSTSDLNVISVTMIAFYMSMKLMILLVLSLENLSASISIITFSESFQSYFLHIC